MKFRIIETPDNDKENEGRTLTLEETSAFLGLDINDLRERSYLAAVVFINGYKMEITGQDAP